MRTNIRMAYLVREIKAGNIKRSDLTPEDWARTDPVFTVENIRKAHEIKEIMDSQHLTFKAAEAAWAVAKATKK